MPFEETHWSLVMRAGANTDSATDAMAELYRRYWPPLYSFLRARGYSKDDASDVLQDFFLVSLEKNYVHAADPAEGRFRTFLLTALVRFASNRAAKSHALKRGGGVVHVRIDADDAEERHSRIAANGASPEEIFERQWAMEILDRALKTVERTYVERGQGELFQALKPGLASTGSSADSEEVARRFGMTVGALRVATHRLRDRYRTAITEIVSETVSSPADIDDELRYLISALGKGTRTNM